MYTLFLRIRGATVRVEKKLALLLFAFLAYFRRFFAEILRQLKKLFPNI